MGSLVFNQIKLAGFKSFVEPTDFHIEPGLTGIVGPNGCGKSNLLEAIRWVMGANSAKAMRAAGMDDVIFNGTKTRPGRNQAHVTLTIDNSARIAPPAFNDDDILEVMRIIKKGGGSKYKINGKTVRAKDVQLLFADASTGANSPALVRQGQISELIAAKPSNRRRILEEAAGISGLHTRRHEAELRLRAAETNLNRLDDIIGQIEGQLLSLRRQSRQATRYKRLAGEINEYKALLWLKRWISAIDTLAAATENSTECENRVADTATKASELTRRAAELSALLEPKREEQIIAAAVLGRLNAAKEALESDEEAAGAEIKKLESQIKDLAADLERETGIVNDANDAEALLKLEFQKLSAVADTSAALDAAADAASEAIKARTSLETDYNELTRQAADQNARRESAGRELSQAQDRLDRVLRERENTQDRLAGMSQDGGSSGNLFAAGARDALNALEAARDEEQKLAKALSETEEADQVAREDLAKSRQVLSGLSGEKTALERMLARAQAGTFEPALNQCKAEPGYEQALAAALGEDLDAAIGGTANLRWGGAKPSDQALPAQAKPLSDYVKAPTELTARLSQIGVVDAGDIDSLRAELKPGQRLVTLEGQVSRWDGFEMAAGAETSAAVKLKQQNRLAEITREITSAENKVESNQTLFDAAREKRNAAQEAVRLARRALPDLERAERAAGAALSQYETDIARATAERKSLEDRLERLDSEIKELTAQRDSAKTNFDGLNEVEDFSGQQAALSEKLTEARNIADEASAAYRSLKNETEARASRLKAVEKERADWARRSETAKKRVEQLQTRETAAKTTLSAATDGPDKFADRRTKLFSELKAAEDRRTAASDSLAIAETELREAENAARDAEQAHSAAREARAGAEARKVAAQERIAETKARINETLSCEPSELNEHLGDLSPESNLSENDIEKKLDRLSVEREKMGGVNLRADEEAVEQEERLTAMNDERQDLIAAIARLREGIDELNQEGRERLLKAFDVVNSHFGRLFTTLFGGGEASLALTESDDPLEAGLEVMARPPGKSLKAMSLLSGGEQALTATALIFAVFLSNPAPVCVLDEVDAPLDDANVARYCDLLDDMKQHTNTKFIAITHNPVTMSRMDRLFGVTMAEQGVSQLLSIQLNDAEKLVAAE
ncbi:condensin subunit Smc [Litorimonas taeanensis]|uniref:Chromosome partition protein Smc n=1 Tax=Litorimonas taeanensis TaxID=568099 RepID=A0A420WIW6_9PROT|nr:chromosome segregation protein SMC [Litorimonas taeanensis]RKQ70974.1 condensin subunit Smc [Litorimonas taeanensis]